MSETELAKTITELAAPLAASLSLDIWGVDVAFGKRGVVRVFVEGENGVSIDACAELSRLLGLSLDVEDAIPGAYVLEVSSPGLERTFFTAAQLAANEGKVVEISLHVPGPACPGRKKLLGTLTGARNGEFTLVPLDAPEDNPVAAVFAWDDIKKAKLVHFLPEPQGAVKGRKPKQTKQPADAARNPARGKAGDEPAV